MNDPRTLVNHEYKKVDFHIHTPKSWCYDGSANYEDIIRAALATGLDAIAVTDHNSAEAINKMRDLAEGKGLHLFPGVEISARGGHVLAILALDTPMELLRDLLNSVGLDPSQHGNGAARTNRWIDEVFFEIVARGGIAITSHIDRWPNGFLMTQEHNQDKLRIHSSPYLSALEITDPRDKVRWNRGQMPNYPKEYACIQGSDAHAPQEVSRRPIFLKVPCLNLENIKLAFQEWDARIRFPHELDRAYWPE